MAALIRDAPVGQLIRWITKARVLRYPEEVPDFQLPVSYRQGESALKAKSVSSNGLSVDQDPADAEKARVEPAEEPERPAVVLDREKLERLDTATSQVRSIDSRISNLDRTSTRKSHVSHTATLSGLESIRTRADLEEAFQEANLPRGETQEIVPTRTEEGYILVDFYTTDDPENPQNYSPRKKTVASLQIYIYTLAVYMGSAIYAPSVEGVMHEFGVGEVAASLGLALYVLAYGLGPLLWSPLAEIPSIGRNPPYMITMGIFVALSVAAPLVQNFAGLLVLRFLQGFFGSPCLATGGASLGDMFSLAKLPYVLCLWAFAATCGPALGPLISSYAIMAENWRWSLWEILWLSAPVFVAMLLFLPETYAPNILLRRAQRIRALTGDDRYRSRSEIEQANMKPSEVVYEALVRPMQLIVLDPAIAFTTGYVALAYAIFYSFFEAFPNVYMGYYGFSLGEMGLTFLSITVAVIIAIAAYYAYLHWVVDPDMQKNGLGRPEKRLIPAMYVSFLLPAGLFLFGWTANGTTHWIVSVIGVFLFTIGVFILLQCIFVYLPLIYIQYSASLFAGNDFARSSLAFAAVLFSRPMYLGMGIGPGVSLLGALTAVCIVGIFVLYFYGENLRARSRFAAK